MRQRPPLGIDVLHLTADHHLDHLCDIDIVDLCRSDIFAVAQNTQAVADFIYLLQVMRDKEHADAFSL